MRNLKRELNELRDERSREQELSARRARDDASEVEELRERCQRLEAERLDSGVCPSMQRFSKRVLIVTCRRIPSQWSN